MRPAKNPVVIPAAIIFSVISVAITSFCCVAVSADAVGFGDQYIYQNDTLQPNLDYQAQASWCYSHGFAPSVSYGADANTGAGCPNQCPGNGTQILIGEYPPGASYYWPQLTLGQASSSGSTLSYRNTWAQNNTGEGLYVSCFYTGGLNGGYYHKYPNGGYSNWTNIVIVHPLVVNFTATPISGIAPLSVQFNDTSTGSPTSWLWYFGDGNTSTAKNPSHTYTSAGSYSVNHSAANAGGTGWKNFTDCVNVTTPLPNANFTATPTSGTAPLAVNFTDTSTGTPTSWNWSFGDGVTSTQQNPSHTYTSAGTYSVSLAAANAGGSNTMAKSGYVVVTTSPVLNQATDIAGRSMHHSEIEDVVSKQQLMNYNSLALLKPSADIIKARLPNDTIFVFTGHGNPGFILLSDTEPYSGYSAKNTSDGYNFDNTSTSYSNLKLAEFFGCDTGNTDPLIGNLVDVVVSKGAGCAMGWTESIASDGTHSYNEGFWTALQNGESIQQAHLDGLNASKYDPFCQSLESPAEDPDKYQYCLFEHLYQQGSSCSQPLPSGLVNQMTQNLNLGSSLKASAQIPPSIKTKLTREEQAIRKFSNISEINPEYLKTIHYSYGNLDTFTTNNSTYIVNRNTGRILSQYVNILESDPGSNVININQGAIIAENYTKVKCPDFWQNETDMVIKAIGPTAMNHELTYSWRQYFKINSTSIESPEIMGVNKIDITLDARNGKLISYNEWYIPRDMDLDMNPALSEEQAWEMVKQNFNNTRLGSIEANQRKNLGLVIAIDDNNIQHLAWQFEITPDNNNRNYYGGQIIVDAHNGQIVRHIRFG